MNDNALRILEYNKIIDMLCEYATCEGGTKLCRELKPYTHFEKINQSFSQIRFCHQESFRHQAVLYWDIQLEQIHLYKYLDYIFYFVQVYNFFLFFLLTLYAHHYNMHQEYQESYNQYLD